MCVPAFHPPRHYHTPTTPQGVVGTVPRTHHSSAGQGDCYIHTDIHTCIHRYIDRHTNITYTHTHRHAYVRTYVHTYIPTYLPTYIHAYMPTCIPNTSPPQATGGRGGTIRSQTGHPSPLGRRGVAGRRWTIYIQNYTHVFVISMFFYIYRHIHFFF